MSFGKDQELLCKPPLENNQPLAAQIAPKQPPAVHVGGPLLGFKCMVAPTSQTACQGDPKFSHSPISRDVQELLGRVHATSKVAPSLSNCVRKGLQAKQVSFEAQETYLKGLKSLTRYESSFKLFYGFCICKNFRAMEATLSEVAGMML